MAEKIKTEITDIRCPCGKPAIVELVFNNEDYDEFHCRECATKKLQEKPLPEFSKVFLSPQEAEDLRYYFDSIEEIKSDLSLSSRNLKILSDRLHDF